MSPLPLLLFLLLLLSPHSRGASLPAPVPSPGDLYGISVSFNSPYAFIASQHTVSGFLCVDDSPCQPWAPSLMPNSQAPEPAGFRVATWQDMLVVGSPSFGGKGAVFVYQCDSAGCVQKQILQSESTASEGLEFGCSVAINNGHVIVGACGEQSEKGQVHVFTCESYQCSSKTKLIPGGLMSAARFGTSVAISGDKVYVGAPQQTVDGNTNQGQVFYYDCTGWTDCVLVSTLHAPDGAQRDRFGTSLAVNGDLLVVGAPYKYFSGVEEVGQVYLFVCGQTECFLRDKFTAEDRFEKDRFGTSVSIEGDVVVVGTPGKKMESNFEQGKIYLFDCMTAPCVTMGTHTEGSEKSLFGFSVQLRRLKVLVGSPNQGNTVGEAHFLSLLCPAVIFEHAHYHVTFVRELAAGSCEIGYYTSTPLKRTCNDMGKWGEPEGDACQAVMCPAEEYMYATWNDSLAGAEATGTCLPGCLSPNPPKRVCSQQNSEGLWASDVASVCAPCPANTYLYNGRSCNACPIDSTSPPANPSLESCVCPPGNHVNVNTHSCEGARCPAVNGGGSSWPQTYPGRSVVGECHDGYSVFEGSFPSPTKIPLRSCSLSEDGMSGDWNSPEVPCEATCSLQPCENNGTCLDYPTFSFCVCPEFYRGKYCELSGAARCAEDIICLNGGDCIPGSDITPAVCDCSRTLYTGSLCQTETVTCHPNPCQNGGVCQKVAENTIQCICQGTGFMGERCELDGLDCIRFGCQNEGYCDPVTRRCDCKDTAFKGAFCEAETVECNSQACSNSGECTDTGVNTISCACPSGFYGERCEINLIILIVVPAVLSLSVIAFFILRRHYPEAQNSMVLSVTLTLYDFATDCLFVYTLSGQEPILFVLSLIFLVLPVIFYLLALFRTFILVILTNPELARWVNQNYAVVATTLVLSLTNIEMFSLLKSRLLYLDMFSAPLGDALEVKLQKYRLVGILIEDIPQLIIQSLVASRRLDTITLLSIMASVLTLVVGLVRRGLVFLVERSHGYQKQEDVDLDPEQEDRGLASVYSNFDDPETK